MKVDGQVSLVYYQYNAPRRPPMRLAFLIPPMLLLAACGQKDENDRSAGTDISINADGEGGGEVQIHTGKDGGKLRIGGKDGAAINIDLPDFVDLDIQGDFDIEDRKRTRLNSSH